MLVDTHCHIQEANYPLDVGDVLRRAHAAGVGKMICVGTDEVTSGEAVRFAGNHEGVWASVGVHPHEATEGWSGVERLLAVSHAAHFSEVSVSARESRGRPRESRTAQPERVKTSEKVPSRDTPSGQTSSTGQETSDGSSGQSNNVSEKSSPKIIAIGEIGLDYFYTHSPREVQIQAFEAQLQLAQDYNLPVIFHVREAFSDFWPIFANFSGLSGVLHSFTDTTQNMEKAVSEGLFIGVNGISTFARDQQAMWDAIPLEKMLLETDAPFLTPVPHRGTVNEPAFVRNVAEYHAKRRGVELEHLARATSANATRLFSI